MSGHRAPDLLLNDEQKMLSKTARSFIRDRAPASRIRKLRDSKDPVGFSRELWREMAELGWLGLQIPEEYGGLGLGFFDLCVLLEHSGRELMPEPFVSTLLLGAQALLLGGTEAQKKLWLPGIASGERLVALAYEESGSDGNLSHLRTTASGTDGRFELTGEKVQVLDAHVADAILVSAATSDTNTELGRSSLFLVDPEQSGVTITRQRRIDGMGSAIVRLDRVSVEGNAIVGEPDEAGRLLARVIDRASVGMAAQMLGASEQAFEDTIDYLKEREQFGVPIGSFQALQHRAVSVFTDIALTRSVVSAAARSIDDSPDDVAQLASLAKASASETFLHAAKEAVQMHGGIGVTDEHDIGLYMKRAHAAYVTFGKPSRHRQRWAELRGY